MPELAAPDFARLFGIEVSEMPAECKSLIKSCDFTYEVLAGEDRDRVILGVLRVLEGDLAVSGPERLGAWERGWSQNLAEFLETQNPKALLPFYNRGSTPAMRLEGQYIAPASTRFEDDFLAVMKRWLAKRYMTDVAHVYEFGCGPGHNLLAFAELLPGKAYHGLDWATASQRIIEHFSEVSDACFEGRNFDMFKPDTSYRLEPDSVVVTMDSMEQLGTNFGPFVDYLLAQSPKLAVHVEPLYELYDETTLFDHLAARYSARRNYLSGFLPALRQLEADGRIEIHEVRKILGSLHQDGWSLIVWSLV